VTTYPGQITIELLSDTTFGCGEANPGVVDVEIERDRHGLPMLGGRSLRGLLRDSWLSMQCHFPDLLQAGRRVCGPYGDLRETGILRIGDAALEDAARVLLIAATERELNRVPVHTILDALTEIRTQSSEERSTGAPAVTTLRSFRVVPRGVTFIARLTWAEPPTPQDCRCLALTVLATRHGGLSRNRGRGHLRLTLDGDLEGTKTLAGGTS